MSSVENKSHILGRVVIYAKWTAITAGVLLSPVLVVFMVWLIGWSVHRWLRPVGTKRPDRHVPRSLAGQPNQVGVLPPRTDRLCNGAPKFHAAQYPLNQ